MVVIASAAGRAVWEIPAHGAGAVNSGVWMLRLIFWFAAAPGRLLTASRLPQHCGVDQAPVLCASPVQSGYPLLAHKCVKLFIVYVPV
jgi:hypothetical protein